VSLDHPVNLEGLNGAIDVLDTAANPKHYYFVVPPLIYDVFQEQPYESLVKGLTKPSKPSSPVRQYALKLELRACPQAQRSHIGALCRPNLGAVRCPLMGPRAGRMHMTRSWPF
jgi:hypothetical protein